MQSPWSVSSRLFPEAKRNSTVIAPSNRQRTVEVSADWKPRQSHPSSHRIGGESTGARVFGCLLVVVQGIAIPASTVRLAAWTTSRLLGLDLPLSPQSANFPGSEVCPSSGQSTTQELRITPTSTPEAALSPRSPASPNRELIAIPISSPARLWS